MNLAIRGIEANLGSEPADSFLRNLHPDLKADYILANPPFKVSDWSGKLLQDDVRWRYGTPPVGLPNDAREGVARTLARRAHPFAQYVE